MEDSYQWRQRRSVGEAGNAMIGISQLRADAENCAYAAHAVVGDVP